MPTSHFFKIANKALTDLTIFEQAAEPLHVVKINFITFNDVCTRLSTDFVDKSKWV